MGVAPRGKSIRYKGGQRKNGPTKEYQTWLGMKARCHRNGRGDKDYGERGIAVCDRWRHSFENFLMDMGPAPTSKHEIDRKNNDADYDPSNCQWATRTMQNRNKRNSRKITALGRTETLSVWVLETGLSHKTITGRIDEYGWSPEKAITTPKNATRFGNQNAKGGSKKRAQETNSQK